jgi:hypothetical protein
VAIIDFADGGFGQPTASDINAANEARKNIPTDAKEAEEAAVDLALAGSLFLAGNFLGPGFGTAIGAIAALGAIVGPQIWKGLKGAFTKKENPWPNRVRKIRNSNKNIVDKFAAAWALETTAILTVRNYEEQGRKSRHIRGILKDDLRWARGGITRARDLKNELFTQLPDGIRQQIEKETRIVAPPNLSRFLKGFPVLIVDIEKLSDRQIFDQIQRFIAIKKEMNDMIRKGLLGDPPPSFVRDQIERYRVVYAGVLTGRIKARLAIAERARKDAEAKRALEAFQAFLRKVEKDIRAFDVRVLKTKKQIDDTLAIAAAWRAQAVAVNATGVIAAIDEKVAQINQRNQRRKLRNAAGVATVAGAALKFLM